MADESSDEYPESKDGKRGRDMLDMGLYCIVRERDSLCGIEEGMIDLCPSMSSLFYREEEVASECPVLLDIVIVALWHKCGNGPVDWRPLSAPARFQKSPRTRPDRCLQALASLVRKPRVLHIRRCHHTTEISLVHRCTGSRLPLIRSHLQHAVCPASLVGPWSTSHSGPLIAQCSLDDMFNIQFRLLRCIHAPP